MSEINGIGPNQSSLPSTEIVTTTTQSANRDPGRGFDQTDRTGAPDRTSIMPIRPWWNRFRFDQIVNNMLSGNTSIRDWQAQEMATMIGALPSAQETVHAARLLAKLDANNYLKNPEARQLLSDAIYDALQRFDQSGTDGFDALADELFKGRGDPSKLGDLLKPIDNNLDLVHAVRKLYKLGVNNLLGGRDTREKVLSEMYGKMIHLAPRGDTGWRGKEAFSTLVNGLLGGRVGATPQQATKIAKLVETIKDADTLIYASRSLEKLRANDYFDAGTFKTVGSAVYDRLTDLDRPRWADESKFDKLVSEFFRTRGGASVEQAQTMAATLGSINDADSAVHATRAFEKLRANNVFNGETEAIVGDAIYKALTRTDKEVPTVRPYHR